MATLVLLRHGESAWNAADVFTGWIDVRLSDRGQQQARQAGQLVRRRWTPPRRGAYLGADPGHPDRGPGA